MTGTTATFAFSKRNGTVEPDDERKMRQSIQRHSAVHVQDVSFEHNQVTAIGARGNAGVKPMPSVVGTIQFAGHTTADAVHSVLRTIKEVEMPHITATRIHVNNPAPVSVYDF